jgi:anti-sigma B factor antagonist
MNLKHENINHILFVQAEGDLLGLPEDLKLLHLAEQNLLDLSVNQAAVDISKINYMNSSGLTILIRMLTMYRNVGGEVVLINPSNSVNKVLIITKLNAIFQVLKTKEEAFNTLKPKQVIAQHLLA